MHEHCRRRRERLVGRRDRRHVVEDEALGPTERGQPRDPRDVLVVGLGSGMTVDAARSVGLDVAGLSVKTTLQPLRPVPPAARTAKPNVSAAGQSQLAAALALLRSDAQEGAGGDRKGGSRRTRKAPTGPASGAS